MAVFFSFKYPDNPKRFTDINEFKESESETTRKSKEMKKMAKCPKCGRDVAKPVKEWDLGPKLHVKLYQHCGKKFREYIKK